jgi:DNA modification methylase
MTVRILTGHVLDRLADLPAESVHCCVTSPPYYGLRDYGIAGQLGLESSPAEYVAIMVAVFRAVRRVLRKDATLWLNIGDSYAGGGGYYPDAPSNTAGSKQSTNRGSAKGAIRNIPGAKPKDLLGIPWMLAFALRDDGWYLRSEITWAKRAPMPESVTDRPTSATEKVFLLAKSARYFYDAEAVKEENSERYQEPTVWHRHGQAKTAPERRDANGINGDGMNAARFNGLGRNMRNWWLLGPEPFAQAHFATFPSEIPRRAILAGTSEKGVCPKCGVPWIRMVDRDHPGDRSKIVPTYEDRGVLNRRMHPGEHGSARSETLGWQPACQCNAGNPLPATVLDPFFGAGTTGLVADQLQRDAVGIELNKSYSKMAADRIKADGGMFSDVVLSVPDNEGSLSTLHENGMIDKELLDFPEREILSIDKGLCDVR